MIINCKKLFLRILPFQTVTSQANCDISGVVREAWVIIRPCVQCGVSYSPYSYFAPDTRTPLVLIYISQDININRI